MRICICGGGSLGHVCAGVLASQESNQVSILSGHPEKWTDEIIVTDLTGKVYKGSIKRVSSNPEEVISNQDIILFCLPGFLIEQTLRQIKPYIGEAKVGTVVSSTGFFFFAHDVLGLDVRLFGFQRVPYIARVVDYGRSANLLGYKSNLAVALENIEDSFTESLSVLFGTPTTVLGSFYEAALTNSNPILHTGRLYTMFHGREEEVFDHNILFYKEWTDEASQLEIDMDCEFAQLLDRLGVRKGAIPSLLDYYESNDAKSLTTKITSIPAFQTILSPMRKTENGWKADFQSRYFTEDFPFGLRWIKELATKHDVLTPTIDKVYEWGVGMI